MKTILTVDGMLSGTGIREKETGYLTPLELGLPISTRARIEKWLKRYEEAHFFEYKDLVEVEALDREGIEITLLVQQCLPKYKVKYFSNAKLKEISLSDY